MVKLFWREKSTQPTFKWMLVLGMDEDGRLGATNT